MNPVLEIQLVAVIVAVACALPGTFLVLRRMAMMSDAISHSILLGIVLGFFLVEQTTHPVVIGMAALSGLLTVWLVETLLNTRLVKADAAIGLVFPALFSVGVILINRYANNVHLDTDAVLLGELAFAPFNRMELFGFDLPRGLVAMGAILVLNVLLLLLFYKELKLATFDPGLAAALGFSPTLIHYGLMSVVSVTAVGAFDHVGSVLVVALMIAPPAAAYLLTDRLSVMLGLAAGIGALSAVGGYWLARWLDSSIAGSMAAMAGFCFLLALVGAPQRGVVARWLQRRRRRARFAVDMLLVHLSRHEGTPDEATENTLAHLVSELGWSPAFAERSVQAALRDGLVVRQNGHLALTAQGRERARRVQAR